MSKKKSFSRSTMTLKDFHGGSIPSDLALPSAPGVSVRQQDRVGFDRSIGLAGGRIDQYRPSRPGSAGGIGGGGARGFVDESAPFLPNSVRIGRNFEEDERKPFDQAAAPRRIPASIDTFRMSQQQQQQQQVSGRPGSSPAAVPHFVSEGAHFPAAGAFPSQQLPGYGNTGASVSPNAWGVRKEVVTEPQVQYSSVLSGPSAASRFAQASAIEKISSGRWQSKHVVSSQMPNTEIIRFSEVEENKSGFHDHVMDCAGISEQRYDKRADGVERRYIVRNDEVHGYHRPVSPKYDSSNPLSNDGRHGIPNVHQHDVSSSTVKVVGEDGGSYKGEKVHHVEERFGQMQVAQRGGTGTRMQGSEQEEKFRGAQVAEMSERPKLKLLPRTKPLEQPETQASDAKAGHQFYSVDIHMVDNINEPYANSQTLKPPGSSGSEGDNSRLTERPKLNLKPRSQPFEQSKEIIERERKALFGDARPRELVLKERGSDGPDGLPDNLEQDLPESRAKHGFVKTDVKPDVAVQPVHNERFGSSEHRVARDMEKKDHRTGRDRTDSEKTSWKNDNWKNARENVKTLEKRLEPDNWRKPVEEPKPDTPSPRHGKAASALELTQVYSRSTSEASHDNRPTKQSSIPGRTQVPFSRLLDTWEFHSGSNARRINGY